MLFPAPYSDNPSPSLMKLTEQFAVAWPTWLLVVVSSAKPSEEKDFGNPVGTLQNASAKNKGRIFKVCPVSSHSMTRLYYGNGFGCQAI